jgi:hypothetical protein
LARILKKEHIDIFSNFFEMGGHSIMAVNVMVGREKTGIEFAFIYFNTQQ